jgi:hypothetical protein
MCPPLTSLDRGRVGKCELRKCAEALDSNVSLITPLEAKNKLGASADASSHLRIAKPRQGDIDRDLDAIT